MSQKIRVLDEHTINKIAAGEVIENPASVVKELVDNAIDAEATEITVEILLGGRKKIVVSDNGSGMGRDDALLSLERHATSKIGSIEDMTKLGTLGFRGEAIPSIASISHFSLLTNRENEKNCATFLQVQGGKILSCAASVRDRGTTITVEHLFFNVPVRKKFQRSSSFDAQEVQKVLSRLQLSHPEVSIRFISEGKTILRGKKEEAEGLQLFRKRAEEVFGKELLQSFVPLMVQRPPFSVIALLSKPTLSRPTRSFQHVIVNGRPIYSKMLSDWVREGYSTLLQEGRQPLFLLSLTVPPDLIDVNVHPQKKEVRFRQEGAIKAILLETVEQAFREKKADPFSPLPQKEKKPLFSSPPLTFSAASWRASALEEAAPDPLPTQTDFSFSSSSKPIPSVPYTFLSSIPGYLLLQSLDNPGEIALLDVQRARQRIFYEETQESQTPLALQTLLLPENLKIPEEKANELTKLLPLLKKSGLHLEQTGPSLFSLHALSPLLSHNPLPLIQEALLDLIDLENPSVALFCERLSRKLLSSSTKNALARFEADALLKRLFLCKQTDYSPKGKAIFYFLNSEKIAKLLS